MEKIKEKIKIQLTKEDSNIYNLLLKASRALRRSGQKDEAMEVQKRVYGCKSYDKALSIIKEYVDVV